MEQFARQVPPSIVYLRCARGDTIAIEVSEVVDSWKGITCPYHAGVLMRVIPRVEAPA